MAYKPIQMPILIYHHFCISHKSPEWSEMQFIQLDTPSMWLAFKWLCQKWSIGGISLFFRLLHIRAFRYV